MVPLLLILLAATPLGSDFVYVILGIPVLLIFWAVVALWSLVVCVKLGMAKLWRRSCAFAAVTLTIGLALLQPWSFVRYCNHLGNVVHFVVGRPYYDHVIARLPDDGHRLAVFNWGGMAFASHGLVYDESDEVALPPGRQSSTWRSNPNLAELACEGYAVDPLWSHYYLASFPC
jgi:hypothetical protein